MRVPNPSFAISPQAEMDLRRLPSQYLNMVSQVLEKPLPMKADSEKGVLAIGKWLGLVVDPSEQSDTELRDSTATKGSDAQQKLVIFYQPQSKNHFRVMGVHMLDEEAIQKLPGIVE